MVEATEAKASRHRMHCDAGANRHFLGNVHLLGKHLLIYINLIRLRDCLWVSVAASRPVATVWGCVGGGGCLSIRKFVSTRRFIYICWGSVTLST